jgi:hypothetical protein
MVNTMAMALSQNKTEAEELGVGVCWEEMNNTSSFPSFPLSSSFLLSWANSPCPQFLSHQSMTTVMDLTLFHPFGGVAM